MSGYLKVQPLGVLTRFTGSVLAVHSTVFPLYRKWPLVPYGVQCAYDLLEINFPAPYTAEVPKATGVAERNVSSEYSYLFGSVTPVSIFHVHVKNPVGKLIDKIHVIYSLVSQMARIVVEPESGVMIQGLQCPLGRKGVESNFGGMYL